MEILSFNRIAEFGEVHGDLILQGDCYIAGKIIGNITITTNSTLVIEPDGFVTGLIKAHDVQVLGTVIGNIAATGKVLIKSSGKVEGAIQSKALEVLPGAHLVMNLDVQLS